MCVCVHLCVYTKVNIHNLNQQYFDLREFKKKLQIKHKATGSEAVINTTIPLNELENRKAIKKINKTKAIFKK